MATFVRLDPDRPHIDDTVRVLKPDEYRVAVSADELLADARARADAIVKQAEIDHEVEKRRGFEEGMAAAKVQIAEQMMTLVDRSVDYLANAEGEIAETVLVCLRKILGEFPEEELVLRTARANLGIVRNEARVTLRVRPETETALRDRVGEILRDHGDVGFLEVISDGGLTEGACRLETDLGVVDASIDQQLDALEKVIRSRIAKRTS